MSANGSNGHSMSAIPEPAIELMERVKSYRTMLKEVLAMVKREGGWRSTSDQMLLREAQALVDSPVP